MPFVGGTPGVDTRLSGPPGIDAITKFKRQDNIDFSDHDDVNSLDDVRALSSDVDGNLVIQVDADQSITVEGWSTDRIDDIGFVF